MNKVNFLCFFICLMFCLFFSKKDIMADDNRDLINLVLKNGTVVIETRPDLAPNHVFQIKKLVQEGKYNGVVFHRVIKDFMAQTGDVKYGNSSNSDFDLQLAGTGGSNLPNIKAEFSNAKHERGAVSMARAQDPNSANSQFFICFKDCTFLDGQYTLWGQVIEGMEFVDNIKLGEGQNGLVNDPDKIVKMELVSD